MYIYIYIYVYRLVLSACYAGAAPYVQCGGSGGECKSVCKDQVWGTVKCQSNFTCRRLNQWYWQCDKPDLPGSTPSALRSILPP